MPRGRLRSLCSAVSQQSLRHLPFLGGRSAHATSPSPRLPLIPAARTTFPQELFEYLRSFHEKTRPLTFLAPALKGIEERFEAAWDAGEVPGWGDKGVSGAEMPEGTLDLDVFESAEARSGEGGAEGQR